MNASPDATSTAHVVSVRTLLTAEQAAREVFGVSERTFHKMRAEPWMPRAIVCGPRMLRWVRSELEAAALKMPRLEKPQEAPAQLRRARIDKMKAAAGREVAA